MFKYLWEIDIEYFVDALEEKVCEISLARQQELKALFKLTSIDLKTILDGKKLTLSIVIDVIKREEILNLILLSFATNIDLFSIERGGLFFEMEDAYIKGSESSVFSFDGITLISQI